MLTLLLPAAGQSSRMRGRDKLLEEVSGAPCLRTMAKRGSKVADQVIVTLRPDDEARRAALENLDVTTIPVPDHTLGMFASLRAGAAHISGDTSAFMILHPDMPGITANDIATLWAAFETLRPKILQAGTQDGQPGHPVIFDRHFLPDFRSLSGPKDTRNILAKHEKDLVILPLSDGRARRDLDTPEDWAAWRADTPLSIG